MHALHPRARRAGLLAPVALAAAGAVLLVGGPGGPLPGGAADRYRAGERASERTILPGEAATTVRARGLARARSLGVPVGSGTVVSRVTDRFIAAELDEVVTTDVNGRRLGIVRMARDGRLQMAVRLGWRDPTGGRIDESAARARATALAEESGVAGDGTATVAPAADGGWRVTWERVADGVPVLGDGTAVTLFEDGTFHAAARRERPLAAAPGELLAQPSVRRIAGERLADLLGPAGAQARIERSRLAWVAPNDTFDSHAPDAPDPVLRLAWVVEVGTVAPLSDRFEALELYLDAGNGSLLGGDLLR